MKKIFKALAICVLMFSGTNLFAEGGNEAVENIEYFSLAEDGTIVNRLDDAIDEMNKEYKERWDSKTQEEKNEYQLWARIAAKVEIEEATQALKTENEQLKKSIDELSKSKNSSVLILAICLLVLSLGVNVYLFLSLKKKRNA